MIYMISFFSDSIWQVMDIGTWITVFTVVLSIAKIINSYFKKFNDKMDNINDSLVIINEHIEKMEVTLLGNDIHLMLNSDVKKEELLKTYDLYKKHGGNSYIDSLIQERLKSV